MDVFHNPEPPAAPEALQAALEAEAQVGALAVEA